MNEKAKKSSSKFLVGSGILFQLLITLGCVILAAVFAFYEDFTSGFFLAPENQPAFSTGVAILIVAIMALPIISFWAIKKVVKVPTRFLVYAVLATPCLLILMASIQPG